MQFLNSENLTLSAIAFAGIACPTGSRCVHVDFQNVTVSDVTELTLDLQTNGSISASSVSSVDSEGYSVGGKKKKKK